MMSHREVLLGEILSGLVPDGQLASVQDMPVTGVTADSRAVRDGFIFAALPGVNAHGAQFARQAVLHGAGVILTDWAATLDLPDGVIECRVENPRQVLAQVAARFQPTAPAHIIAITGTNGKTSVAGFLRQLWEMSGVRGASIGTVGVQSSVYNDPDSLTTPDPVTLHATLATLQDHDVTHVALEASSHGLSQYRLDGAVPKIAVFTNFSRDHLDYHGTEEAYFLAKARLFTEVLHANGTAVVDVRSPAGQRIAQMTKDRGVMVVTFGDASDAEGPDSDVSVLSTTVVADGTQVKFTWLDRVYDVHIPLIGSFQVGNVMVSAIAAVLSMSPTAADGSITPDLEVVDSVVNGISRLRGEAGRMELMGQTASGGSVFVDYAHTPDGLEKVLAAAQPHTEGALWVVFGCGGDRDAGKRPIMGAVADRMADCIIVTDDNPRTEEAAPIRDQIREACPRALDVADRAEAIKTAMAELRGGDVLVVAGKGHETGQIIGHDVLPYSDREAVLAVLTEQNTNQGGENVA